jgi:hypothetical protein
MPGLGVRPACQLRRRHALWARRLLWPLAVRQLRAAGMQGQRRRVPGGSRAAEAAKGEAGAGSEGPQPAAATQQPQQLQGQAPHAP